MKKPVGVLVALLLVVGGLGLTYHLFGADIAYATCDAKSLRTMATEQARNGDRARYLLQEANVCEGKPLTTPGDQQQNGSNTNSDPLPGPTATPSTKPTTAKPAVRKVEYLANRPVAQKMGLVNNFGPETSLVYRGKKTADLNAAQAKAELVHRIKLDPMLAASTGASLDLWPDSQVDDKTKLFAQNHREWDKAVVAIQARLAKSKLSVQTFQPGTYSAVFALPGTPPLVRQDSSVTRTTAFTALVVKLPGGKLVNLRLECGFQEYARPKQLSYKALPKPSKHMTRTEEGVPEKEKPKPEKERTTPTPIKPGETKPTTTPTSTPTSTPTPSKTPTTSTPTPTDTPSTTPTPTDTPTPTKTPGKNPSLDPEEQGNNKPGGGGKEEGGSDEGQTDEPGTTPSSAYTPPPPPTKTTQPRPDPTTPAPPPNPEPTATSDPCQPVTPACG